MPEWNVVCLQLGGPSSSTSLASTKKTCDSKFALKSQQAFDGLLLPLGFWTNTLYPTGSERSGPFPQMGHLSAREQGVHYEPEENRDCNSNARVRRSLSGSERGALALRLVT
jgi:hypothetical protein